MSWRLAVLVLLLSTAGALTPARAQLPAAGGSAAPSGATSGAAGGTSGPANTSPDAKAMPSKANRALLKSIQDIDRAIKSICRGC